MSPHGIVVIVACTLAMIFFIGAVRRGTSEERRIKRLQREWRRDRLVVPTPNRKERS